MTFVFQTTVATNKTRWTWGFQVEPVEDEETEEVQERQEIGFYVTDTD